MAGLGTLLLILIIFFLILPLFRVGLRIYGFQKKAKDAFSQFNQQQQEQAEEYELRQRRQQRQQRQQRRKSMGEYVDFEEITDTSGSASPRQSSSKKPPHPSEPLISDAEWEDIK